MKTALVLIALIACGCASFSGGATTQPTAAGVLTVTSLWTAYDSAVQTEILAFGAGVMSKAQLATASAADKQAYQDILAAQNAALAGDSAATGLLSTATISLQNAQNAVPTTMSSGGN